MMRTVLWTACATSLLLGGHALADAEKVRISSFNVENWRQNFLAFNLQRRAQDNPAWPVEFVDMLGRERREDDEENWEVALTILHPDHNPDIILFQEGPDERDLTYFNREFLGNAYTFARVFPSNTNRGQTIGILMKPGFKVLETRDQYHLEPDTDDVNPETDRLFARGPAFVLVESPAGNRFWVGTNHMKSKGGNSVDVTRWRNAEAVRTHQIIHELKSQQTPLVVFGGDFNDEVGIQEFEAEGGGSSVENLVGTGDAMLVLATESLVHDKAITFHGQRRQNRLSFIDHFVLTPEAAEKMTNAFVFTQMPAALASDHYPVVIDLQFPER
jgi:endonuclease/exonuclease/phosphatase family metal-dependent hydrolase